MRLGYGPGIGQPCLRAGTHRQAQAQVFQNSPDDHGVLDEAHDAEPALTMGADQGVDFEDLLDQACPVLAKLLRGDHRLQHGGDRLPLFSFAQPAPGGVGLAAVVTNALLAAIGDVGPHGDQPFQGRVAAGKIFSLAAMRKRVLTAGASNKRKQPAAMKRRGG